MGEGDPGTGTIQTPTYMTIEQTSVVRPGPGRSPRKPEARALVRDITRHNPE